MTVVTTPSDDGGNDTDDDDDSDDSGSPLGSISKPELQEWAALQSMALGLWKCAALHGRHKTEALRPHTHGSQDTVDVDSQHRDHTHAGLYEDAAAVDSQYRSSTTFKTNSTVCQVPASTGFLSQKQ
ncbi:hypothetical protein ElyMa_005128500 [Elysia marginata]|uniref:Uncharacterized protein n=1 Tax=Elysia marginata TaxID=1093978 RepID=A0AAV4JKJ6_9GAST|nr:hypothetical protein ElyMa_005128500 [Elysia marginata]